MGKPKGKKGNKMSYNVCECGNVGVMSVRLMNRGRRSAVMCDDCFRKLAGHGGKALPRPGADSKPVLKDVVNAYSVRMINGNANVLAELARHGCDTSRVARNAPRVYFPEKTRLNSAVRYAESLRKLSEREGVQWEAFELVLRSDSVGVERKYRYSGSVEGWADFVRNSEDHFCNLIGCPQWSALKTGTRKN